MDKKEKKMKNKALVEALASNDALEHNADGLDLSDKKKKKSKSDKESKKRKAVEVADDGDRSETSSELGEPVNSRSKSGKEKKSSKKAKVVDSEDDDVEKEAENPNAVTQFRISEPLKAKLREKGITSLFPIQATTFDTVYDGSDLVGRARTGQGKTLAFVLPILESLVNGPYKSSRVTGYGRSPSVIVLLPTRELADQVFEDFKFYGRTLGLDSCCLCGGLQYGPQEIALKRGVDIVVGTPGRVKDHINRNNIDLRSLKFRVLDEADEMLNMGFVDDVEFILGKVADVNKVQTLLFSATLPDWVKNITSRFLKASKKTVDLVGNEKMKASKDVRHIVIPCSDTEPKSNTDSKVATMADKYEKENLAEKYLEGRPRSYPAEWYSRLAALTAGHSLACDFGTGNGQAALGVAEHYKKVIGIDVSKSQLECAMKHERVQYLHLPASMSEDEMVKSIGEENTVDLIISAEAVHWFDLPKFYAVATRLLRKPGGIIAVWGYYYISLNEAFDAAMNRLTEATLPYWDEKVKEYVLKGYRTMPFPFESVGIGSEGKPEEMEMEQKFSFEGMLKYLKSMGPVITAKENGVDVMCEEMVKELRDAWGGGGDLVRTVVYKCFMIAGKVKA